VTAMKQYIQNLWASILGKNPHQQALDACKKEILAYQNLIELLRERIKEKDELIGLLQQSNK